MTLVFHEKESFSICFKKNVNVIYVSVNTRRRMKNTSPNYSIILACKLINFIKVIMNMRHIMKEIMVIRVMRIHEGYVILFGCILSTGHPPRTAHP